MFECIACGEPIENLSFCQDCAEGLDRADSALEYIRQQSIVLSSDDYSTKGDMRKNHAMAYLAGLLEHCLNHEATDYLAIEQI
jgi:hypothetical protein